jgi:MFS family permease
MGAYDPLDPNASQTKKGWLTAILELGAWVGTLFSGFMAEAISRKYGIIVACCVFIIGVIIQATSIEAGYQAILGGRFITYVFIRVYNGSDFILTLQHSGMGVGSLSMIVPIYNSEVAPP